MNKQSLNNDDSDLQTLTAEDKQLLLGPFKGETTPLPPGKCLFHLCEELAQNHPDYPALEWQKKTIRYSELNQHANQLAHYLKQLNISAGQPIAVCLPREPDWIITILALWKLGAVYVPIEASDPRERIDFYLRDSDAKMIITNESTRPNLPGKLPKLLSIDRIRAECTKHPTNNLNIQYPPEDLAYILYTSGSTGTPKGVLSKHSGLLNVAVAQKQQFELNPNDRIIQYTSVAFDVSLYEITMAWGVGACLILTPMEDIVSPERLVDFLERECISAFTITPTILKTLPQHPLPNLRVLISCGETCTPDLPRRWATSNRRFFNAYGPTEVSIWSTTEECTVHTEAPTIGRPIPNLETYILDSKNQLVPIGTEGELCIGGIGLASGYLNRPEITAKQFIPHPFSTDASARIYRTGDRAVFLSDGRINLRGRFDHQVKIASIRIELEEIEHIICNHPAVLNAIALLHNGTLHAAYIPKSAAVNEADIRTFLATQLNRYLIPKTINPLNSFPLTTSGKADRRALEEILFEPQPLHPDLNIPPTQLPHVTLNIERNYSFPERFCVQAKKTPKALAVAWNVNDRMTYQELHQRSERVKNWIAHSTLSQESIFAVLLDRSPEALICMLGIMKAGATYLPISVNHPSQRIANILEDAQATALITTEHFAPRIPQTQTPLYLLSVIEQEQKAPTIVSLNPETRAYIIYTSGSTGRPKGVEIEHHSLTNLIEWYHHRLQLTPTDRTSMIADIAFDASIADICPYLSCGGSIHIPSTKTIADPALLCSWYREHQISVSFIPTALAELLLKQKKSPPLRYLLTGGDALHGTPPPNAPYELINTYGPTENTVDSTWATIPPNSQHMPPPIGFPIANCYAYILDENDRMVAEGERGELCLAGENLARGYLNRPDLNTQKFPQLELIHGNPKRVYRTGDWVSSLPDGQLAFHGRMDDQIQLRGFRIELGEIEQVLLENPAIFAATVNPIKRKGRTESLAAYLVLNEGQHLNEKQLHTALSLNLPAYMVPSSFTFMPDLPRGISGKIDRERLPPPATSFSTSTPQATLETPTQEKLSEIWTALTNNPNISPDDNFFEIGGHSILAVQMVTEIEKKLQRTCTVATVFQNPILRHLATTLDLEESTSLPLGVIPMATAPSGTPIFCLSGAGGGIHFLQGIAQSFQDVNPFYAIDLFDLDEDLRHCPSIEKLAAKLIEKIEAIQPFGPYRIGGFSLGGTFAFEVARQLTKKNSLIELFFMIHAQGPKIWNSKIYQLRTRLDNFRQRTFKRKLAFFIEDAQWRLRRLKLIPKSEKKDLVKEIKATVKSQLQLVYGYKPPPLDVPIVLFQSAIEFSHTPSYPCSGWSGYSTQEITSHTIPGDHFDITDPDNASYIANTLCKNLHIVE